MSHDTNSELNNLLIRLSSIRADEKKMNEMAVLDGTLVSDLRKEAGELQFKQGKFEDDFKTFMIAEGFAASVHMLDVICHFWNKQKNTIQVVR